MSGRKREVATINPTGNFDLFLTATAAESRMLAEATSLKNMEIEARLKDQKIIAF